MPPTKDEVQIDLEDTKAILKHVLKTLTERCNEEAENNSCSIPLDNISARIKYYTGLSNSVVYNLIDETPESTQLDLASRVLILETIKVLYVQHRLPTYNIIYEGTRGKLKDNNDQPLESISDFMREMKVLGYDLKKTVNNSTIVMENPEVRFERFMYLHKLKKLRSSSVQWTQIVYVDERLINLSQNFEKPSHPISILPSAKLNESIFYHAVSKNGFITGMFSNQDDFHKWVTDVLLVQLKNPSIIILDSLHGPPESVSPITRYHSKTEMLHWLTNNSIPCSNNMSKPALYELIARCNENQKEYKIDRILKSQGHEVLRLPRHLSELSITTPLWNYLKKNEVIEMKSSLIDLQSALMKKITSMPSTTWLEFEEQIEKFEKEIFNIDTTIENFCDMYEIMI